MRVETEQLELETCKIFTSQANDAVSTRYVMGLSLGQDKPRALKSKPRPKLQYDTIFQTYSLVSIPHRNHLNLNLNPHKSVSTLRCPSFFFVTETSTHPNPHCELQRRGQGSTTLFRTQYRQGLPNLTLSSEYTSEPQSRHWSDGFVDFVMGLSGFAWICWRRRVSI